MKNSLSKKTIYNVIKQNKKMTFSLIIIIVMVVICSLVPAQILKLIIDNNLIPKKMTGLTKLVILYILVTIFIGIFDFSKDAILTVLGQKIIKFLRMELSLKLEKLSAIYFSNHSSGEVTSRLINDVESVNSLFTDGAINMMIDCLKIIGIVVSIWLFSFRLGIITLCIVPIIYVITRFFQRRMLKAQITNLAQLSKVNEHISESLKNIKMIKLFSKEYYMENKYGEYLNNNYETVNKVNFYDASYSPIIQIVRAFTIAIIILLVSDQINFIGISLGMVAASIELISNLFSPIEAFGMELQNVQKGLSGVRRLDEFYSTSQEPDKSYVQTTDILTNGKSNFVFENVSFAYDSDNPILTDISFHVQQGTSVTFAGRTGVGKTTLFRIIMGLIKPDKGRVVFNGVDVYDIPNKEKRRIFGYVEQQFSFISGTVSEQITLCDKSISKEQVEEAVKFVGLHDYVICMEQGYDTVVNEKTDFSQGQMQLLSIARAIVTNPPVLLLDEVTANLDSITESNIVTVLQRAKTGKTVFSVSHRMTSILQSDKVVMLEEGRITKIGSPKDLLMEE